MGWCTPVRVEATGATLKTYVYRITPATGAPFWIPCRPEDVRFSYSLFSHPDVPALPVGGLRLTQHIEKFGSEISSENPSFDATNPQHNISGLGDGTAILGLAQDIGKYKSKVGI
jgi:hypothetical protein